MYVQSSSSLQGGHARDQLRLSAFIEVSALEGDEVND